MILILSVTIFQAIIIRVVLDTIIAYKNKVFVVFFFRYLVFTIDTNLAYFLQLFFFNVNLTKLILITFH